MRAGISIPSLSSILTSIGAHNITRRKHVRQNPAGRAKRHRSLQLQEKIEMSAAVNQKKCQEKKTHVCSVASSGSYLSTLPQTRFTCERPGAIRIDMDPRRFVIPDIHGCARTFRCLLENVIHLGKDDHLYLLGDMIDRGPRSKEVIDTILQLRSDGYNVHPLRGNHEEMFVQSCRDRSYFRLWMLNGGRATLDSFGVEDGCDVPPSYRQFIAGLPYFIELPDFVLVHGSLNFQIPDPLADTEAMLWSRDTAVNRQLIGGRRVIGGHTPVSRDEIRNNLATDRITLDNGCVYRGKQGLGSLAALELNSMTLYFQDNIDV